MTGAAPITSLSSQSNIGEMIMRGNKRIPLAISETKALDRMRTGSTLIHMSPDPYNYCWFVVPGGPVKNEVADRIKSHPAVIPGKDGLWPGHDQTWRMRSFAGAPPAGEP
jgi:hypothetical protein